MPVLESPYDAAIRMEMARMLERATGSEVTVLATPMGRAKVPDRYRLDYRLWDDGACNTWAEGKGRPETFTRWDRYLLPGWFVAASKVTALDDARANEPGIPVGLWETRPVFTLFVLGCLDALAYFDTTGIQTRRDVTRGEMSREEARASGLRGANDREAGWYVPSPLFTVIGPGVDFLRFAHLKGAPEKVKAMRERVA